MKNLILMCLFGLMFSQTELTTRVYELPRFNFNGVSEMDIDLTQITGYNLDYAVLEIVYVSDYYTSNEYSTEINLRYQAFPNGNSTWRSIYINLFADGENIYYTASNLKYAGNGQLMLAQKDEGAVHNGYVDIFLSVTAEFPIEDTGYIEEGFDFCLHSGHNLVSFPCDTPVDLNVAIPQLALNQLSGIIGEGVAATNLDGQFVGSLSAFSPGAGYWFDSTAEMCFNYTCVE